jgi:hypothetical protein
MIFDGWGQGGRQTKNLPEALPQASGIQSAKERGGF